VTADVLERLLATCASDRLVDARDAALLSSPSRRAGGGAAKWRDCGSSSSPRRRRFPPTPPIPSPPSCPASIRLGRTKTTGTDTDARVFLVGRPVAALREWLSRADIIKGPVFRAIDQWGGLDDKALTPQAVNWPRRFLRMDCGPAI
jgi:hypothetical protein